jgi:hypothetical protein
VSSDARILVLSRGDTPTKGLVAISLAGLPYCANLSHQNSYLADPERLPAPLQSSKMGRVAMSSTHWLWQEITKSLIGTRLVNTRVSTIEGLNPLVLPGEVAWHEA